MTSREALSFVRRLKGLHIVGADVVEISPPYDQSDLTALLGAALMFEFLSLMSEVR
jgi:guanidinopropionase